MTTRLAGDARVIGLVGAAHFVSHFFQLALPPLFPLMRDELGVSWTALGFLVSVFYAASGIGQTIAGFVVDRTGARPVLFGGMGVLAGAMALAGLAPTYGLLVAAAFLAGLGNSVFHPADYSIINSAVTPGRVGRAYSVHGIGGTLGYATGPAVLVALAAFTGWRTAAVTAGTAGVVVTVVLALLAPRGAAAFANGPAPAAGSLGSDLRLLLSPPILAAFVYFLLYATAQIGFQTFSVTALVTLHAAPLPLVAGALTGFLLGNAGGILAGGVLADRARRPDLIAGSGLGAAAAFILVIGGLPSFGPVTAVSAAAGVAVGLVAPSRDLMIRSVTPPGASGKVFGFAYSGLDAGSALTPLLFGWLLDRGAPRAVFVGVAVLLVASILALIPMRRHAVVLARR